MVEYASGGMFQKIEAISNQKKSINDGDKE